MARGGTKAVSVFLVGPMGAGKTTIGRQLAKALRLEFVDSDHEIEARTGATIPLIFDVEGEAGFRQRESTVIDDLTRRRNMVVATGGGAVLREENRACLSQRGIVVYLCAPADYLYMRTARDKNRPLLQTDDPMARIVELLEMRDPLYRDVADIVYDTSRDGVRIIVRNLVGLIRRVERGKQISLPTEASVKEITKL